MLTVIERYPDPKTKYICRCDCGNKAIVVLGHLTSIGKDKTFSCGCHRKETGKRMAQENGLNQRSELVGQKFGRLLVIEFAGMTNKSASLYKCLCDCGQEKITRSHTLLSGRVNSCGCLHREVSAENLRRARFKHGLSNERAYLNWQKRQRYKDEKEWTYQMEAALRNLQPNCVVCGSEDNLCVDHVFPFSKGGKLIPGNAVNLCRSCNSFKNDKLLSDLPADMAEKIANAAYQFKEYWGNVGPLMTC
jgi:5-methylcytosine-specific restriction endonuclease McrA